MAEEERYIVTESITTKDKGKETKEAIRKYYKDLYTSK